MPDVTIPLIIHHGNCPDGYGSAFWLGEHLGKHEKMAAQHRDDLADGDVSGRDVYLVDFVYDDPAKMQLIAKWATRALVLDHHKTAWDTMAANDTGFLLTQDPALGYERFHGHDHLLDNHVAVVAPEAGRSGIGLTARYVKDRWGTQWPDWFDHLEARDLWDFDRLPHVQEVFAAVTSYPYTETAWKRLLTRMSHDLIPEGAAIERYRQQLIDEAVNRAWLQEFTDDTGDGTHPWEIWVTTCPYNIGSDVAGELAKRTGTFGVYLVHQRDGVKVGLRSAGEVDVAEIAEHWGGGGHRAAAGFVVADENSAPFGEIL